MLFVKIEFFPYIFHRLDGIQQVGNYNNKTIWIINQYASHLATRHEELSKSFAAHGYRVAVITSSFHHGRREYMYNEPITYKKLCNGVSYVYLHSGPSYQNNGVGRIFNMIDFCRLVRKYQNEIAEKIGIPVFVIASSAPPFVWEVGYTVARKFKAKYIAEFRDIWPMSLVDVQGLRPDHPLVKVLSIIEKRAYKHADAIVSTMPYAWQHVMEVADIPREKIHWMANGINVKEIDNDLQSSLKLPEDLESYLSEHWCCVYIGSIVKSECLDYLLKCFSGVQNTDIYFAVVGEGHEKERIQQLAKDLQIKRIKFFPAIDKHLIPKALQHASVAVAAHEDLPIYQFGLSMNKLNDYLVSGKPTIFACNAPNIVKEAGHFAIPMGDSVEFAKTIERVKNLSEKEIEQLRKRARQLIFDEYDYPNIGARYLRMMEAL